jgi:hypothetical protein
MENFNDVAEALMDIAYIASNCADNMSRSISDKAKKRRLESCIVSLKTEIESLENNLPNDEVDGHEK